MKHRSWILCLALASALVAAEARAQEDGRGFDAQQWKPTPGAGGFLTVEGARVPDGISLRLGGVAGYQLEPLVLRSCERVSASRCEKWAGDETPLVEHHLGLELHAALGLYGLVEIGLAVPAVLYQTGDRLEASGPRPAIEPPARSAGLGDPRLHLKVDLIGGVFGGDNDVVGLALVPIVTFPVGSALDSSSFLGDSSVTVEPVLALGLDFGRVRLGFDAGYRIRERKEFFLTEQGARLSYGAAAEVRIVERLSALVELYGDTAFDGDASEAPLEGDAALAVHLGGGVDLLAGGGAGIVSGVGAPVARAFFGASWAPEARSDRDGDGVANGDDACPDEAEDADGFEDEDGCPDADNDGDGVPDADDECAFLPEDADGFEDGDGCPDADNDGDGLLDEGDACPDEAEDANGVDDGDGCPDGELDADGDGVPLPDDACPDEAEDADGFEDGDGCPDADNDGDGVPDADDVCPGEAEVVNEFEDDDGCPDTGEELVVVKRDRIKILQKIQFAKNKAEIRPRSHELLDAVVAALEAHPRIRVRIEGHTDARGRERRNRRLSEARAKAVLLYLIEHGIEPDRLLAAGFGSRRPIADNDTREGRAENRRVEFVIIE